MTLPGHSAPADGLAAAAVEAALEWWREAGVDLGFADTPRDWLAGANPPEPRPAAAAPPASRQPEPTPLPPPLDAGLPATLEEFAGWWLAEPALDNGQVGGRVPPRGPAGAALMVLVEQPESEDTDRLLSGPQGHMLDAVLAAAGLDPAAVYVASCLPRHTPMADWGALAAAGMGRIVARHAALAAPQRLLVLGAHASSLLGHDPAKSAENLPSINQEGATVPFLVGPGLVRLAGRPRDKARLWDAWLRWTG